MGPTNVKNEEKGAYETRNKGNIALIFLIHKY